MGNISGTYQHSAYLANDLLLEVECGTDDGNSVGIKVSTVLSRRGVHSDKFLQL